MSDQSSPFRVLVVDDVEDNRTLLVRRLERRGYITTQAENGSTTLSLVAQQEFDLVLLDIMMPGIDGLEVLKRIRASRSADELPVIMVTARASTADVVMALELGANDYITKPIEFSVAHARVQTQLNRKRTRQALDASLREIEATNHRLTCEIEERQRANKLVSHLTNNDPLTSLSNRSHIRTLLQQELQVLGQRQDRCLAFMLFDLDGFGSINSALGHETGDRILFDIGQRLCACLGMVGHVGRTGADEFAIVAPVDDVAQAISLFDRLGEAIAAPNLIDGHTAVITACAGATIAPNDATEVESIIENAQLALDRARDEGRGRQCFFELGMDARAKLRRLLELDMQKAFANSEFENFYQPQFNLALGAVCGAEALVRWKHPFRGLISPADFIPLAEQTGLIVELGARVLHQACKEAANWPDDLKVAVNISTVQLGDRNFMETVVSALARSQLAAHRLELEITETVSLKDNTSTVELLHQLRRIGVRISLDDFGTGYSSLNYLRAFPFDKIKIDKSFVDEIGGNRNTMTIIKALIDLSDGLGADSNAEGVENEAQLEWLRSIGCNEIQGYLISPPLPATDFRTFARSFNQIFPGRALVDVA